MRRTLELADEATARKVPKARAKIRVYVWQLIAAPPAGFRWLVIAGKTLAARSGRSILASSP